MAAAKRHYEGGLIAWHACAVIAHVPFTGRALDPNAVNPYRVRDPAAAERLESVKRFITGMAWAVRAREAFAAAGKEVSCGPISE